MWFGKPGQLVELPQPTGDMRQLAEHDGAVHKLLAGRAVDFPPGIPKRVYQVTWEGLDHDDWAVLEGFATRQRGIGPWVMYLDETRRNYLTPNQAAGTDPDIDTTGFSVSGVGESLASSATQARTGVRSLAWTLPASVATGLLTVACPVSTFPGWPCTPTMVWSFSAYTRTGGTDTSFDVRCRLRWLDTAGGTLSTSDGSYVAGSSSNWDARPTVTATAPSSAAYVLPLIQVDATDVSAAAVCYLDDLQLELGQVGTPLPGTSLPLVSILPTEHGMPSAATHDIAWDLQEV